MRSRRILYPIMLFLNKTAQEIFLSIGVVRKNLKRNQNTVLDIFGGEKQRDM